MIELQVGRALNINGTFKVKNHKYGVLNEHSDGRIDCIRYLDNSPYGEPVTLPKELIPESFNKYRYYINNFTEFEPGRVIFVCKVYPDRINKLYGIIRKCSSEMISFTFRDTGGELRTQGLTARQIANDEIMIRMFPEPKVF